MFIGGYQIIDCVDLPINITSGSSVEVNVGAGVVALLKNCKKPIWFANVSINHHSLGRINIDGYATRVYTSDNVFYKFDGASVGIINDHTIIIMLITA